MKNTVHIKKEPYDVYIGRGSVFGNPFTHKPLAETKALVKCKTRKEAIQKHKLWILGIESLEIDGKEINPPSIEEIWGLKDKVLGCWCSPKECHGDFLAEVANMSLQEIENLRESMRIETAMKKGARNVF